MARLLRWLFRAFLVTLTLAGLAVVGIIYFASRSVPDYDASYAVPGLGQKLEIVRDNANVPHIMGQTDADSFFGLGFVHAQDRLWQMMVLRRTAQGKLSEILGPRTLTVDKLMRRLDIYGAARASVPAQSPGMKAALDAYADGVNAWIGLVNTRALGRGAPEFFLFSPEIAPWQPEDSIAIAKIMALQLTGHLEAEVLRARLSLILEPEQVRQILPDAPGTPVTALPDFAALFPDLDRRVAALQARPAPDRLNPVKPAGLAGASNVWAALPGQSAAGGTLLANDPHLGLTAPSIWYLARMELETGPVIGGTIPGMPTVVVGRSRMLGWGMTATGMDDLDIYLERLDPEDPERYRGLDGYVPFRTDRSVIQVRDAAPVTLTRRWTENGPVLPGEHFGLASVTPPGHVTSIAWTALSRKDTSLQSSFELMHARDVPQALGAGRFHVAPAINITLADTATIAMTVFGRQPDRDPRHQSQGRLPTPGWRMENRWRGLKPFAANPVFRPGDTGLIGNTNNKITDAPFPDHISFDWNDTQRIRRWTSLMQDRKVHTRDSFIEAQLDTVSMAARTLVPLMARDLWFDGPEAPHGSRERLRQDALRLLADWNGSMNEHLPEPLIYAAWLREVFRALTRDELGPLVEEMPHPDPVFLEKVFRDTDGAGQWCDVIRSSATETCTEIAQSALDTALLRLSEQYGTKPESWRWGDAHQAAQDHPVLGDLPYLGALLNIRQSTSGGDETLMRGRTSGKEPTPFLNVHAAGYRGVYDFADPDSSVFVISTGQSGHPLSRHYDDLGELWRRGEYIPMSLDIDLARGGAAGITILTPEQ